MNDSEPQLVVVEKAKLAERAADIFVGAANTAVSEKGLFTAVLSGGSTPRSLYQLLAKRYSRAQFWQSTHIFFADERCVPPNDPESNYGMIASLLLSRVNIPEENIHRW
ncbi:MAG TPA: 6-phosphogluconolactonase, partial [Armatimonadota bacterium]|nr:6-phosphogluconolactonase [Armatimonadota bacterium]